MDKSNNTETDSTDSTYYSIDSSTYSSTDSSTYSSTDSSTYSSSDISSLFVIESTDDDTDDGTDDDMSDSEDEIIEITEDELFEITQTVYQIMEEYITKNLLLLSSGKIYKNMIKYAVELIFTDICEMCMIDNDYEYDNDLFEELTEFVENVAEIFLDIYYYQHNIPRRSLFQNNNEIVKYTRVQMNQLQDKIQSLQNIILPEQRTKEWYEFRYQLITASNLWKVFGTESQVNSLIYEKCKPLLIENTVRGNVSTDSPLHWGIKYEPVTVMLYEYKFHTTIGDFGCIPHPTYPFIGASPDGINIDINSTRYGRMVEIKNIVNREITGIPKDEYWIQTQIQMETCDLDECDFVETRFKEYDNASKFYQDNSHEYKGVILHFIERPQTIETSNKPHYIYMPINTDINEIEQWIQQQRDIMNPSNYVLFATNYWYLDELSCVLIQRNRDWFLSAVPFIKNTWDIIVKERVEGYEHRASKKKQRERALSQLSDDGIQPTVLSKGDNPICLIKLDENGNIL